MTEFTLMRHNMVNCLLKPNGINNLRILHAFHEVPRETFLSDASVDTAYADIVLNNYDDEKLLTPLTIAKILQALNLAIDNKILIIGSTNLYTAAILSYCCCAIHILCDSHKIFQKLNTQLTKFSCYSIKIHQGNLINGLSDFAPYDHILIEGGIKSEINLIVKQLKTGGSAIYLSSLDPYSNYRVIKEIKRDDSKNIKENLFECDGFMVKDYQSAFPEFEF